MESNNNEIFTKDMYLQYLHRAYTNMYADKVIDMSIVDDDYFIVKITFSYKKIKFNIKIPNNLSKTQFITFVLGTLTKKQLKHLNLILINLCKGTNLQCYDYAIYKFNEDNTYWNNIRNEMLFNYKGQNKDALKTILKL